MAQLGFFKFLLMQASFMGVGLWIVAAAGLIVARAAWRRRWFPLLPATWLLPLVLGGVFVETSAGAKTADWMGWVGLGALAVFFMAVVDANWRPDKPRWPAVVWSLVNLPLALMSAVVVGIAAGGTWP